MNQDNGGIIGKLNTPTTTVASGVWTLQDQFEAQTSSIWPLAFPQTTIANSCRFDDGSSDSLNKTFGTPTNNLIWSFSAWVKRSSLGTQNIFSAYTDGNNFGMISFNSSNALDVGSYIDGYEMRYITNRVFRDLGAFYHLCVTNDSSLASPETKIYINGVLETSFSTSNAPSQNEESMINKSGVAHWVGQNGNSTSYFDGYMAEVIFIDGQALDQTSFGAFNPVTNIWEPRGYAGTYGNNGFRLDFANSSALGNDVSGNDNDFTVNNLTSIDQSTDTCSNNFATMNPLDSFYMTGTYSNGNLDIVTQSSSRTSTTATLGVSSGKWYWEVKLVDNSSNAECLVGIDTKGASSCSIFDSGKCDEYTGRRTYGYGYYSGDGNSFNNGSSTSFGNTYDTGDIIGVALDLDNNKLYFSKNGTFQNSGDPTSGATGTGAVSITAPSSTDTGVYFPAHSDASTSNNVTFSSNFGNPTFTISSGNNDGNGYGNFEYSVPSGYFSLCTKNLAEFG